MPDITIEVTEAELLALQIAAKDPQVFADNVVTNRARVVVDELAKTPGWATAKAAAGASADKWAILIKGNELGLVGFKTAATVAAEIAAADEALAGVPPTAIIVNPDGTKSASTDPKHYPLSAAQFETALILMGLDRNDVEPVINRIFADNAIARADALGRWRRLEEVRRDSDLITALRGQPEFNVTDAQIDTAWMQAAGRPIL
ncbi:hypothetical protein [Hoeflea sp.]|uniref:hypothetical protein n=1 Tax=Hoeflea sp. TaxID=1940281 RepID=UPI003BB04DA7